MQISNMTALHKKPIADLPLVNEPANIPTLKATPPPSESPNIRLVTKEARDYISALWDLCFNQASSVLTNCYVTTLAIISEI